MTMIAITSASSPFPVPRVLASIRKNGDGPLKANHAMGVSKAANQAALCAVVWNFGRQFVIAKNLNLTCNRYCRRVSRNPKSQSWIFRFRSINDEIAVENHSFRPGMARSVRDSLCHSSGWPASCGNGRQLRQWPPTRPPSQVRLIVVRVMRLAQ